MRLITKEEAREFGIGIYFNASLCKLGHLAPRLIGNGECLACRLRKAEWGLKETEERIEREIAIGKRKPGLPDRSSFRPNTELKRFREMREQLKKENSADEARRNRLVGASLARRDRWTEGQQQ